MRTLAVIGLAISTFLSGQCSEPRKPVPPLDDRHVITVDGSTVRYNGKLLSWDVPAERWQDVLGPYSRRSKLGRVLVWDELVWDELGIVLYEDPTDSTVSSLAVAFGQTRHPPPTGSQPGFWPKKLFPGRLIVDGALIHKDSTILEVNSNKKTKPYFRRGVMDAVDNYDVGDGYHVCLDFGSDDTLTEFSISKPSPTQSPKDTKNPSAPKKTAEP